MPRGSVVLGEGERERGRGRESDGTVTGEMDE